MKCKTVILTESRTLNFEKVEFTMEVELAEGEKADEVAEKMSVRINQVLDAEVKKISLRQSQEKQAELNAILANKLPETKEEAYAIALDDGRKLEDLTSKEMNALIIDYDVTTKIGKGLRLILGIVTEGTANVGTNVTATTSNPLENEFAELKKERNAKFFKNGNHSFADATQKEVDGIRTLNNKALSERLLNKLKRFAELAPKFGVSVKYSV